MRAALIAAVVTISIGTPAAQSDLDALMARVLSRRDDNWKKLQQYVLEERETLRVEGPEGRNLFGFRREYQWYPRDGFFVRSPLRADGVPIAESDRRQAENAWLRREQQRERRRGARDPERSRPSVSNGADRPDGEGLADVIRQSVEPQFVSSAYFLRFRFDEGSYAFSGRESLLGREVLRIEYYPTKLFTEGRTRPNRRLRERDPDVTARMNKASLVTLWVDPAEHQILRYEAENIDFDFLPGRQFARFDDVRASMEMAQPFAGVWLPASVEMVLRITLATGDVNARYDVLYHDYRLASATGKVR